MAPPEKSAESDNGAAAKGEGDADRTGPPEWLDVAFIQKAFLRAGEENVLVERIEMQYAVPVGDNYCSRIFRAIVHARGEIASRSLIVKIPPEGERFAKILKEDRVFEKETLMLTTVMDYIQDMFRNCREEIPLLTARCLNHGNEPDCFLVLQDLKKDKFYLGNRREGLNLSQASIALRALGLFHAANHVIWKKQPEMFDIMKNPFESGEMSTEKEFQDSINTIAKAIGTWSERYGNKLQKIGGKIFHENKAANNIRPDKFNTLVHGDFWVNNMMFRDDDDGNVVDIRFLDLQLCHVTNPAIDLILFRYTSCSEEIFWDNWDELLDVYVESLSGTLELLGEKPITKQDILEFLEEAKFSVFIAALMWLPLVKMDKGKFDIETLLTEGSSTQSAAYHTPEFTYWMKKLLPEFDHRGLLD